MLLSKPGHMQQSYSYMISNSLKYIRGIFYMYLRVKIMHFYVYTLEQWLIESGLHSITS